MRRWIAVFLLVLLPLQFSWAAMAGACGHDDRAHEPSLAHHGDSGADMGDEHPLSPPASPEQDCGHCHGSCCSLPSLAVIRPSAATVAHPGAAAETGLRTAPQSPPERPQWLRLA